MSPSPRHVARRIGAAILLVIALFFVGRAVAELVMVDPGRPETYRDDWGGPSYVGVVLVHAGPGLVVLALVVWWLLRRGRVPAASPTPEHVDERPGGAGQHEDDDERRP